MQVKAEFIKRGAHFLTEEEKVIIRDCPHSILASSNSSFCVCSVWLQVKVRAKCFIDGRLNANIVGQSVEKLAALFDIK